jgi:DNA-binding PadR family transcriptional regulator
LAQAKLVYREVLLSFWKVHILHHAGEEPVHGQWILTELRRHGYEISPGTLYPLLNRMARLGWLKCTVDPEGGRRARKDYVLTEQGRTVLHLIREQVQELHREVVLEHAPDFAPGRASTGRGRRPGRASRPPT